MLKCSMELTETKESGGSCHYVHISPICDPSPPYITLSSSRILSPNHRAIFSPIIQQWIVSSKVVLWSHISLCFAWNDKMFAQGETNV